VVRDMERSYSEVRGGAVSRENVVKVVAGFVSRRGGTE